ncbi:MAG: hypothetical protein R3F20_08240 [Planctomycetota bacterium]
MDEVKEELDRLQTEAQNNESLGQANEAASGARSASEKAENALDRKRPGEAGREQINAAQDLQRASDAVQRAMDRENERRATEEERMKELARRQEELEKQGKELAQRLKEKGSESADKMQKASEAMERASQSMNGEQPDSEQAEREQEEALDYLDEAREELRKQRDDYQDLQQEELLFNTKKEIEKLIEAQEAINAETVGLDARSQEAGGVSRSLRKNYRDLGVRQEASRAKIEEMNQAVKEEQVLAFTFLFDELSRDMTQIVESLKKFRGGTLTQALQGDVLDNLRLMTKTLDDEIKARQQAAQNRENEEKKEEEENEDQPEEKPKLVNEIAELILVRNMQEKLNERTKTLLERSDQIREAGGLGPVDELLVKRLLARQNQIKELFEKLLQQQAPGAPNDGSHGEEEDGR